MGDLEQSEGRLNRLCNGLIRGLSNRLYSIIFDLFVGGSTAVDDETSQGAFAVQVTNCPIDHS